MEKPLKSILKNKGGIMEDLIKSLQKNGLLLEDKNVSLLWNLSLNELIEIENPDVYQSNNSSETQIVWRNIICLSGLRCTLSVKMHTKQRLKEFELQTFLNGVDKNARDNFSRVNKHLKNIIGAPTSEKLLFDYPEYPVTEWKLSGLTISFFIFDRFGEYCILKIKKSKI